MISRLLVFIVGDLICSKDGSISLTRLAAVSAHFLSAIFFVYHNATAPFSELLWFTYLGFATGHAAYDKTLMLTKGKSDGSATAYQTGQR